MPVYLIKAKHTPSAEPRVIFGRDAADACRNAGVDPANAVVKDVTRRTLSPRSFNQDPLTADFIDDAREDNQ